MVVYTGLVTFTHCADEHKEGRKGDKIREKKEKRRNVLVSKEEEEKKIKEEKRK